MQARAKRPFLGGAIFCVLMIYIGYLIRWLLFDVVSPAAVWFITEFPVLYWAGLITSVTWGLIRGWRRFWYD